MTRGFVDLHCHWIPGIDDGARSEQEALDMLRELGALGFELVVATPHMRPGLFDNTREDLEAAFHAIEPAVVRAAGLPRVALSSEHYFDELIYRRLLAGTALPYPGERAALIELNSAEPPPSFELRLADLTRSKLTVVLAHPERCSYFKDAPSRLERLVAAGVGALLDANALCGAYGRTAQRCAEALLDRGLYHAACSDAHRPEDAARLASAMALIEERYGPDEVEFLFRSGPLTLLEGRLPS